MNATLLVIAKKTIKRKVALKLPCTLGRGRKADVKIEHPVISRKHCELTETNGLVILRDLVSLNGTMIGGRKVLTAPLLPNAEFTIGPLTFRVKYEYDGDLEALPETCYAPESEAAPAVRQPAPPAEAPAAEAAATPILDVENAMPAEIANLTDSQIVEVPDFVAWADADPDEVLPAVLLDDPEPSPAPLAGAVPPLPHPAARPTEPFPAVPLQPPPGGAKRESPWSAEEQPAAKPGHPATSQPSPRTAKNKPSYSNDDDPEFGSFLEELQ